MQQERSLFVLWGPSRVSIGRHLPRILSLDFCKQKKWVFRCSLKWFVEFFLHNEPRLNNVSFFLEILQIWGRNQSWQWSGDWWACGWWNNFIHFKSISAQTSASYHFERGGVQPFWKFGRESPRLSQLPSNSFKVGGYFIFKIINHLHLVQLMPRPSTALKIFWAGSNFLSQTKNWYTFCATPKDDFHSANLVFVPAQKCLKRHY